MYHVRKVKTNDLPSLMQLELESYYNCWSPDMWNQAINKFEIRMSVMNYHPIGFWAGTVSDLGRDRFRLFRIGVRRRRQDQGNSFILMRDLFDFVNANDYTHIDLAVSEEFLGMYEDCDYSGWLKRFQFKARRGIEKDMFFSAGKRYDGFHFERDMRCNIQ